MATQPNILMISIDALRPDRMSLHGYERPTTPVLSSLAASGTYCADSISTTAFTQPALPSMLTSSQPLSYGGYDRGAVGRPDTLFKVLAANNYKPTLLSTFPWVNRFYGYSEGVAAENLLFVINALVGVASQTMASFVRAHHNGEFSHDELIEGVRPILEKLYGDLDSYCDDRIENLESDRSDLGHERLMTDGYDYPRIKKIIARHKDAFAQNPKTYVDTYLSEIPNAHNWIARDWRLARKPSALCKFAFDRLGAALLQRISPARARLMEFRNKRYIDAHALADRTIRTIEQHDKSQPFFVWTHFFDTHVPYCPGAGTAWKHNAGKHLTALGYSADTDLSIAVKKRPETASEWETWRALYDASIHYVDTQIGRVLEALRQRGLDKNTLVVITSDHGEELGEHGDVSHHFRLYEHNIRIPIILNGPDVPTRCIEGLTTIMDLSPTITDTVGINPTAGWEGRSIYSHDVEAREHVLAEAFHSGNCLFEHRPPYIAVRTKKMKYLWKEYRDTTDTFSSTSPELFDHRADPLEQNDLYCDDHPALPSLNKIVARRLADLPEISDERIVRAFGDIGAKAIAESRGQTTLAATVRTT